MTNLFNPEKGILVNERVLLKLQEIPETLNGIYLTDERRHQERMSLTKGELVKFADGCFKDWKEKPKVGDIIYFHQYSGRTLNDERNEKVYYRNISPKDIYQFERKE